MVEKSGGTYDEPPGHVQEERPELKEYPSGHARDEAQPKKAIIGTEPHVARNIHCGL